MHTTQNYWTFRHSNFMDKLFKQGGTLPKVLISMLIIAILAMSVDFTKFTASLGEIHLSAWILAIGFLYVQILALSYRWLKLINIHESKISFGYAVKVNLASMLANYLFITSIGGIIVRVVMSVKGGVSFIRSLAATGLDRMFTLFALFVLSVIFLPFLGHVVSGDIFQKSVLFIFGFVLAVGLFCFIMFEGPRKKIIFSHRKVAMCFQYLRAVLTTPDILGKVVASSLIGQLSYFMAAYFVIASMGVEFSWLNFIAVIPFITLIASMPIGYGGWGIREGAFIYGLGLINIPFETAFAASIQIGLISMAAAVIAGIPVIMNPDFRASLFHKK